MQRTLGNKGQNTEQKETKAEKYMKIGAVKIKSMYYMPACILKPGPGGSDLSDVSPESGSHVWRVLTGPGFGVRPALSSSRILTVAAGVRSS